MSTITKEWLQQKIAEMEAARDEIPFGLDEDESNTLAALRIALASLEAEPAIHRWRRVTVEPYGPYPWHYGNFIGFSKPVEGIEDEYFYSAPPAPVVPEEATPENIAILASTFAPCGITYQWDRDECNAAADSWNACRAAMLQGAEPVTTAYKFPELTDSQCIEFLAVAFRHARIKGDIEFNDIRLGLKMALWQGSVQVGKL